ncbi:hypothetical protein HPP92_016137 [Vanilla planifolia]|uniref:Trafficking protein particle complex subunit 12 n=1 Tax=Vanilla planifolia TaxID=51239 RepID=A0A835QKM8_VANPL|nr:hypothetical protein HPP92_016137 [Vanilla planifolia]
MECQSPNDAGGVGPSISSATASIEAITLEDPLSPSTRFYSAADLAPDLPSLLDLASRGQWLSVLDKVARARTTSLLSKPHEHVVYLAFNALALHKLRRFTDASLEIDSLSPVDDHPEDPFQHHRFLYESYPEIYPSLRGSMLPFAVRLLYADLPQRIGNRSESLDRFYSLLCFTRARHGDSWRRRENFVLGTLSCNHFIHRELDVSLALIRELIASNPADPVLLSRLGYVQLQIGDLDGAKESFSRVEGMKLSGVEFENLVGRNRALGFVVSKEYVSAVREYEQCIERDPRDVVAVNNKALCLMYSRDLSDSIKQLEGTLERVPTAALNETLVVNLCSMYELAYVQHGDIKKSLSNWIARVAPDDFDPSCTRI